MNSSRIPGRTAIIAVASISVALSMLLFFLPESKKSSGHDHGHGAEEAHEGGVLEVDMDDEVLESSGMTIAKAEPVTLQQLVVSRGQIVEDANKAMNVKPRFSGIVKSLSKDFGDSVRRGDVLMVIESAATRSTYQIRAAIDGVVVDRRVVVGSFVPENESVLRVVDLSNVWFKGQVTVRDAVHVKPQASATVSDAVSGTAGNGQVAFLSPTVDEDSQSREVRIALVNEKGIWRIGSFAKADIQLEPVAVDVAVMTTALQDLNGQTVVFRRESDHLLPIPVKTGLADAEHTQIIAGIAAGDTYVATNSYLAKAELMKASAEHEH